MGTAGRNSLCRIIKCPANHEVVDQSPTDWSYTDPQIHSAEALQPGGQNDEPISCHLTTTEGRTPVGCEALAQPDLWGSFTEHFLIVVCLTGTK